MMNKRVDFLGGPKMARARKVNKFSTCLFALTMFVGLISFPTSADASTPTCKGLAATIVSSAQVVTGTSGADVIVVRGAGIHTVNAGSGNDVICGSIGNDRINAGAGNDYIAGNAGIDTLAGGAGNDVIAGGSGPDSISGGAGNDSIKGESGSDSLAGNAGNDRISGDAGNDTLSGGAGGDNLDGGAGKNSCTIDAADLAVGSCETESINTDSTNSNDRPIVNPGTDSSGGQSGVVTNPGDSGNGDTQPGTGDNVGIVPVIRHCAFDEADLLTPCTIDVSDPGAKNTDAVSIVKAGAELTFMWSINDRPSIDESWVKIAGPSGWVTSWCGFPLIGTRIPGPAETAVFSATCKVPENAVNTVYKAYFETSFYRENSKSSSVDFRVTGGSVDIAAPAVTQIELSSPTLASDQTLDITFTAEDETGVKGIVAWVAFNGYGFANNQGRSFVDYKEFFTLTSGDEKRGSYRQHITLNSFAPAGEYTIWISSLDKLGNKVFYRTDVKFNVPK
ncbi:MAG: hypothetical protein F2932_02365 [Actinobacteria bacterium]|nr:hypothetical protein [Actinomycetota bacterium]